MPGAIRAFFVSKALNRVMDGMWDPIETSVAFPEWTVGILTATIFFPLDIAEKRIPNWSIAFLGFMLAIISVLVHGSFQWLPILATELSFVAGVAGGLFAMAMWQHQILGGGDVKFLCVVGVFCPFLVCPLIALSTLLAAGYGLITSLCKPQEKVLDSVSNFDSSREQLVPMMPFFAVAHLACCAIL